MAKFNYIPAACDDDHDDHLDPGELPPPPREFFELINLAREHNLWLHKTRYRREARERGGRYKLTPPRSRAALMVTDSLDEVRKYLEALR